jgi:hypothetical protein
MKIDIDFSFFILLFKNNQCILSLFLISIIHIISNFTIDFCFFFFLNILLNKNKKNKNMNILSIN